MAFGRHLILKASSLKWVESVVRKSFLFRPLVKRFIAGDTLEEAMVQAEALASRGLLITLDCLGENTTSAAEAKQAIEVYKTILKKIACSPHRESINISIKLTQCGFDLGDDVAEQNYRDVLAVAKELGIFVRVDMESSHYTERTLAILQRVLPDYPLTGTVLQTYLRRTPEDVETMIRLGARVRLVKGAYLEPESVALPLKQDVDRAFVVAGKRLIEAGNYPAIATHDEAIIRELKAFAAGKGIANTRFEWQMLYGIRRDLQDSLAKEGYPVRIYVPYGDRWYPYFTRRLAERPANVWFIVKSMFRK